MVPACCSLVLLVLCAVVIQGQYNDNLSPAPPRVQIPGAVPLGPPRRPPLAGARLQARRQPGPELPPQALDEAPKFRGRAPGARTGRLPLSPTSAPQYITQQPPQRLLPQPEETIPPRPVIEEAEDEFGEEPAYSPSPSPLSPPPPQPQRPQPSPSPVPAFRPERPLPILPTPTPEQNYVSPVRPQVRPRPVEQPQFNRAQPLARPAEQLQFNRAQPVARPVEQPQFNRAQPFARPVEQPQFNRAQAVVRAPPKSTYTSSTKDDFEKPERRFKNTKKPTAQVLRRYREENEDGSITWGFENDDGSFKEETIGKDCVTYGKYGYIDPDGARREYTYNTGIPCDKAQDAQSEGSEGYIDYAENKYVLPSGEKIDLNHMGKSSRRPVQYRS